MPLSINMYLLFATHMLELSCSTSVLKPLKALLKALCPFGQCKLLKALFPDTNENTAADFVHLLGLTG